MTMLKEWKNHLPDRRVIQDFMGWLQEHYRETEVLDLHVERIIDEYHGIDRRKLDDERRAILDQYQEESDKRQNA